MKQLKKAFKVVRYVHDFGATVGIVLWVIIISLCMILMVSSKDRLYDDGVARGAIFFMLGFASFGFLYEIALLSQMIGASPRRKMLEITIPNILTVIFTVVTYLLVVGVLTMRVTDASVLKDIYIQMLVRVVCGMSITVIYLAVMNKAIVWGSVIWFLLFSIIEGLLLYSPTWNKVSEHFAGNWWQVVTEGGVLVGIALICSCLLRKAVYRKRVSPYCGGGRLRKAMQ